MARSRHKLPEEIENLLPMRGHIFEGKYRVVDGIGVGGFARVYHARFEDVARDVALKILIPQSADRERMYPEELVRRFLREARAISELRSQYTITLHDFGRTTHGLLYMIFEFVDGTPLDRLIKKEGALAEDRVVHITEQVLQSLREAHALALLHRDIKPANVMVFDYLDERDQVRLLDFGIAKTWNSHETDGTPTLEDLTEDGTVMGTPRYMSPEQIVGQQLTPQSDIYGVGLLMYEMLAGVPAAPQTIKTEVVRRHLGPEPFVLPSDLRVSARLRATVERMLSKDITRRHKTVDEVLHELTQWRAERQQVFDGAQTQATPSAGANLVADNASGAVTRERMRDPEYAAANPMNQQAAPGPNQQWQTMGTGNDTTQGSVVQPMTPNVGAPHTGPSSQPVQVQGAQGVAKPASTFLQVRTAPDRFELDVPMKPTKRALLVCGLLFIPFFLAFVAGGFVWWIATAVPFLWGVSLVFQTYRVRVSTQEGYEISVILFGYERSKRGPLASVVRFEARGADAEDNTVVKLITHDGEYTVANAFSEAESAWLAAEGNEWITQMRARHPAPTG